jgi:hypothetical protein
MNRICILFFCLYSGIFAQGVLISSTPGTPDPSAGLHIDFNDKGFLPPKMSTQQRNAIQNPAQGLLLFNTTTECLQIYYNNVGWRDVSCNCNQPPPTPGPINGATLYCENSGPHTLSIAPVPGASGYQWTLPSGATLSSAGNDTSIQIQVTQVNGAVSVIAFNQCGQSNPSSLNISAQNPSAAFTLPTQVSFNVPASFTATQSGLNYSWAFASGSPSTATTQTAQTTWSTAGTYAVQLIVQNAAGCADTVSQNYTVLNCVIGGSATFTNCGQTGRTGPTQTQCNNTYGAGVVTVTSGIQYWTVPAGVCTVTVDVYGAQGGGTGGGLGARMRGDFAVTPGNTIGILVGQQGAPLGTSECGGGGGGSFVFAGTSPNSNNLWVAAAGGGGFGTNGGHSMAGQTASSGISSCNAAGGTNGNGGASMSPSNGGSGAGWLGSGGNGTYGLGGQAIVNGGLGGDIGGTSGNVTGGFGGGGAGHTNCEGGGGGGYSGGASGGYSGSCRRGGGGGSLNTGQNQLNQVGVRSGNGQVVITW